MAPEQGAVFTRETLGVIEKLTEEAWQAPYSSRVDSLTNYSHSEALGDDLIVGPLVEDAASLTDADLGRIEDIANSSIELARPPAGRRRPGGRSGDQFHTAQGDA